jgi:hypothetical protein
MITFFDFFRKKLLILNELTFKSLYSKFVRSLKIKIS